MNTLSKDHKYSDLFAMIVGAILIGALGLYICSHLRMNDAPDEQLRYSLAHWIYENGKLPIGDEAEIVSPIWGFSYAYRPYLFQLISALFMKVASLFSKEGYILLIAARLTSVLCYVGTYIVALLIGREIACKRVYSLLFALFICLNPQIAFLSGYVNNDIPSVFASLLIVLFLVKGWKKGWNNSICIGLGIAIGLCLMSYYNAYVYVVISLVIYIYVATVKRKLSAGLFIKYAAIVAVFAVAVAGWYFIRNAIIYHGDFLGLSTQSEHWAAYASETVSPENIFNGPNSGMSVVSYFVKNKWFELTVMSFVGIFGYMIYTLPFKLYAAYVLILAGSVLGYVVYCIIRKVNDGKQKKAASGQLLIINCMLMLSMGVPLLLSMYYSYSFDFEPQGRYIITLIIPFAYMLVKTCQSIGIYASNKAKRVWLATVMGLAEIVCLIAICVLALTIGLFPNCFADMNAIL